MDIVDSQVHGFYEYDGNQLIAIMGALGIQKIIIDELWAHLEDGSSWPYKQFANGARRPLTPKSQGLALEYPNKFALVRRVNWRDPELISLFSEISCTPGCRAVRMNLKSREDRQALADGKVDEIFTLAIKHNLPVCLLIHGQNATELVGSIARKFSSAKIILDHCGNPKSEPQWEDVLRLSELNNIWLKWCHAHHSFVGGEYPYPALQSELVRAIKNFGSSKILWASDVTHEKSGSSWGDLLHYVRDSISISEEDKSWILGRTACSVFNW